MCCFSVPVAYVGSTSIFARFVAPGRQALVYSMSIEAEAELAMVLPLPVAPGSGEDAVEFVSLEGYPRFFDHMAGGFPVRNVARSRGGPAMRSAPARTPLAVHPVGDFEASFVPTVADFDRLDPRFRLDDGVWDALPAYRDYGFAVFKLQKTIRRGFLGLFPARERKTIHPMAFIFPSRRSDALFAPTLHIHDGSVDAEARFDHTLYCQRADGAPSDGSTGPGGIAWRASIGPASHFMDRARTQALVDADAVCWQATLRGMRPNADVWIEG